ncbi:MAG: type IV secretion system protein TraC [Burkholderiales bacterium]|nr:type IV secretion system protein TraC [Burkholderiales bacterium]
MLRQVLNKYHADNIPELMNTFFKKMKKGDVPDAYVKKIQKKKTLNPRKFDFSNLLETNRLADILPYEWFDEETSIYQTARAHGFIFDCGSLVGCSQNLDDQLKSLFNLGIPVGTCMQILLIASSELEDKFNYYKSERKNQLLNKIATERINFYKKGLKQSLKHGYKFPVRDFRLVISFAFDGVYDEANQSSLVSLQQSIGSVLRNNSIYTKLMQPNELINLLREILCSQSQPVEKHIYDKRRSIRDQVADIDNNIYVASDGLCINNVGLKSIAIGRYPDEFRINQCDNLIGSIFNLAAQISHPFFLVQNITFLNQGRENTKLQTSAVKTAEQVKKGKFTALFPLFHRKHQEYQMLQQVISTGEGLMLMAHYLHVYYPLGHAESAFQEVKSLYQTFGFTVVPNSNLQLPSLLCSLPLFHDLTATLEQKRYHMMTLYTQTNVVNMMPLFSDYKGTGKPVLMFLSRRGQLQFFDLFQSDTNYNVAISANSGAGKSFLTNEIVTGYQAIGAKVSIIDVGKSYKNTCEVLGGQYVEFTKEAAICINPFSFIKLKLDDNSDFDWKNITKEQLLALEDLDDQITMLKGIFLVSAGIGENDSNYALADSYFEQAIIHSLQKYQTNSTYTTVYEELLELGKLDDNGIVSDLANAIKSYTKHGIFGKYFEGISNLDLNSDLIVLELEELQPKGNLKFIALLILMLKITQDMYLADRKQKKICIIDEAWDLMSGGNTGKFIVTGYRRARKYNGAFITITQRIDDYSENPTTQACYSNAAWKIMLKQGEPRTVKLDEYTIRLISNLKSVKGVYSDLLIQLDDHKTLCRFIVDDFTQFLYSTSADDITLNKLVRKHENLDMVATLERVVTMMNVYVTKYNRPRSNISSELLQQIHQYGYEALIANLGI